MAIKINLMPKQEADPAEQTQTRPFYFAIVLVIFAISLLAFAVIYYYNNFLLKKQLTDLEKQDTEIQGQISSVATSEELSALNAAILKGENTKSILSNHYYTSRLFGLLESLTIKSVSYGTFSEKVDSGIIKLSFAGFADSFNALAKQLIVFKKSKDIKNVNFNNATSGKDGKITFSMILEVDPKVIINQPIITLIGPSSVSVTKDSSYTDEGADAIDGVDGKLKVTASGTVKTDTVGRYTLIYTATNSSGYSASATRTVDVINQ